jgi:hypothetical protein
MSLVRRVPVPPALDTATIRLVLIGWDALRDAGPSDLVDDVFFEGDRAMVRLWRQHETRLRAQARRLKIAPEWPEEDPRWFFGEWLAKTAP